MAFLFEDANTEYMFRNEAVKAVPPFTIACAVYADTVQSQTAVSLANSSSDANYHRLSLASVGGGQIAYASTRSSVGEVYAVTSTQYSANTWHRICGVWAASDDRRAYIDGGSKGTNSDSRWPAGIDRTGVGCICRSSRTSYFSGSIAEVAVWDVALSDEEVAVLGAWYSPLFVRPQNLLVYWPMVRKLGTGQGIELIQSKQLLVGIAPDNEPHCPVIYPAARQLQGAASGVPLPVIMQYYKKMRVA